MDTDKARKVLVQGYADHYSAPYCSSCKEGKLIGDVLHYDENIKLAAINLNVFISEISVVMDGKLQVGLLLQHDPALCPITQCGHGDECCMVKNQTLSFN